MPHLNRTDADGIAHIEMTMPERLNALSDGMIAALQDEFDGLMDDRDTRVVILSGAGKAFCAGHNLKEMQAARQAEDAGAAALGDLFDRCATMMKTLQKLPQPVIAQTHGVAVAAGCQLVASCDLAVAAETCRFGVNGVNIGLFCSTPMVALTRNLGRKAAFELLTTGRLIDAAEAQTLGLINRAVPEADLAQEARALALTIASKLPVAVKTGKQAFYEQAQMNTADAYAYTGAKMVENMLEAQTNEGITAFLEKRKPDWS
ncbi:enoyl-CoA hydratase [Octadecabacter sp. 1_MG-2023]|uniref:enoyl-CoA hydratase n=1 Tax=unclassified Octadecabacter TaxID=196158 RepID=UPI001C08494F|nr:MULTISPECIES: enoyl-CoA hydratase [unclassified Octadecabacter]MBU2993344.1 enoyl-CoA hydratase [Octadecabacter sp. B2R22]MDO6733200.1 enoyl-CoA hydratase [Octadecabacter sp. 1_MG-2023]